MFIRRICFFISLILALVGMAFYTLFERKRLSYCHRRKGPNKVGVKGLPQPFADAVKLFIKEYFVPQKAGRLQFLIGPVIILTLAFVIWCLVPFKRNSTGLQLTVVFFFCVSSLGVYSIFLMGWASNSKYAVFGAIRAVAQVISYEVVIILLVIGPLLFTRRLNLVFISEFGVWFRGIVFVYFFIWMFTCLAETNRAPFDFVEGESELVSGFNVEYGGVGFAIIFIAEYINIIFISVLSAIFFAGGNRAFRRTVWRRCCSIKFVLFVCVIMFLIVQARAAYPRYRYDLLINLTWKKFLPCCLGWSLFLFSFL